MVMWCFERDSLDGSRTLVCHKTLTWVSLECSVGFDFRYNRRIETTGLDSAGRGWTRLYRIKQDSERPGPKQGKYGELSTLRF